MTNFKINNQSVGEEHRPFVIAEAGVHHLNSLELAKAYILQARIADVDAIKFQTYKASKLAASWAPTYWDTGTGETQFDIFARRDQTRDEDYAAMSEYSRNLGVCFLSTPFDSDSAHFLNELDIPAFKIASADLTNLPLLRTVAAFKKPLILSTGAALFDEIEVTLKALKNFDCPIALLHCSLAYPTPLGAANLKRISELREKFGGDHIIGYSDHTQPQDSELPCALAVGLGARIVEKHFTLNKASLEDDHYHAVDTEGLKRLVKNCRESFQMTSHFEEMTKDEEAARQLARRSIVAAQDLEAGAELTLENLDFKRPGTGVSPIEVDKFLGKKIVQPIGRDGLVQFEHLQ